MGNEYDVAKVVNTTDPKQVKAEVERLFLDLYPSAPTQTLDTAFRDVAALYRGRIAGVYACDTAYHDIQHILAATLAMARLMDGYERSHVAMEAIGERHFRLGIITALYHDIGYLRRYTDTRAANGAQFTKVHVSRGAEVLRAYLPTLGMSDLADIAAQLIHFTGYEKPIASIQVPAPRYRLLGNLLGSADLIAQMSDRCYLEKCRDRLYPEFVAGGMTRRRTADGEELVVYESGEDLVRKTPGFYACAARRLHDDLNRCYRYAQVHFRGDNLYIEELNKNVRFAEDLAREPDLSALRRRPPVTLEAAPAAMH